MTIGHPPQDPPPTPVAEPAAGPPPAAAAEPGPPPDGTVDGQPDGDTVAEPDGGRPTCGLDDCDNPLPPRPVDAHGRAKAGKPRKYCCDAHADEASRRRRALEAAGVEVPVQVLRGLRDELRPYLDGVAAKLDAVREQFDTLEQGAVARIAAAEATAAQARIAAADATAERDQALRDRAASDRAAAQAVKDRAAAERSAAAARDDAEHQVRDAWQQVATHKAARAAAETRATEREAAADVARRAAQRAAEESDARLTEATAEKDRLAEEVNQLRAQLATEHAARTTAETRAADAERARSEERDAAAADRARLTDELAGLREQLAAERAAHTATQQRAEQAEQAEQAVTGELSGQLAALLERLTTAPAVPDTPEPDTPGDSPAGGTADGIADTAGTAGAPAPVAGPAADHHPDPADSDPRSGGPAAPADAAAPEPDGEPDGEPGQQARRHAEPELGADWTTTYADGESDRTLWWGDERVGHVRKAGLRPGWEATRASGGVMRTGAGPRGTYPSRIKALTALAAEHEHRRRATTTAGRVELAEHIAPGWYLAQTEVDRDQGVWRVHAPGGAEAGHIRREPASGHLSWWEAWSTNGTGLNAGAHDADRIGPAEERWWRTRTAAARAVARWYDPELPATAPARERTATPDELADDAGRDPCGDQPPSEGGVVTSSTETRGRRDVHPA